jgi:uncharacterized lipoprotein YddW (UPF0748 family)
MKIIRGVWLTKAASRVLDSQKNIAEALKIAADSGCNTVFPVVWSDGYTLYHSEVLQQNFGVAIDPRFAGRDILAEIIDSAPAGLDVIPWFEYGFAASYGKNGGHILEKKPEWGGRDRQNQFLVKNHFVWMNSLDRAVQDFLLQLFIEVATKYKIAGVQGDDRLPAMPSEGGYDAGTIARYRREWNREPPRNPKDRDWSRWRADILSDFLARLYREIKAIDPGLIISMAPSPYPFGYSEYLQDYPAWLARDIVDLLHPQLYRRDFNAYKRSVDETIARVGQEKLARIYPGMLTRIGDFQIDTGDLWRAIQYNRRSGIRGEVFFFFESLPRNSQASFLRDRDYQNFMYLQQGNIGDDVAEIQQRLIQGGYLSRTADGRFDARTKKAIERFQRENSLRVDGIIGPLTYARLCSG